MFANRCATLLLLAGLTAACTDTPEVVAPINVPSLGPSLSAISAPDVYYVAHTTRIDLSYIPDATIVSAISDGTQTVSFSESFEKILPFPWGTPPDVESPVIHRLNEQSTSDFTATLTRPSTIVGFEALNSPGSPITARFYSASGTLLETVTRTPTSGALLFAAVATAPITRVDVVTGGKPVSVSQVRYGDHIAVSATMDGSAAVNPNTGVAVVTGTVVCASPTSVALSVSLQQSQKARRVPAVVLASGTVTVACNVSQAWNITLTPVSGAFVNGDASATLSGGEAGSGLSPITLARNVKLSWAHK